MGEETKHFLGGIAEKTDGYAFGDINQFLQLKHYWLHFKVQQLFTNTVFTIL